MKEIQVFSNNQFGDVRTIEESGKILFCGSDVAKALGYQNTKDALGRHCKEDGVAFHDLTDNLGRNQQAKFINEGNLYRLIVNSKLPTAEKFECWVFEDVLPTIRKHGMYATDELLDNPDLLIGIATKLKEERAKNIEMGRANLQLTQKVAEYEPKIQYLDQILLSQGVLAITQIAADYGLSAKRLNKILNEEHVQHNIGGQWILYREHMNLGYTKSETIHFNHSDGRPDTKLNTKWTQKGRLLIHSLLEKRGVKANMDVNRMGEV